MANIFQVSDKLQFVSRALGEWNNSKMWETRETFFILHEAAVWSLVYG